MISARSFGAVAIVASIVFGALAVSVSGVARADEECPLGSVQKSESGETWCEPTVCGDDTQCPTGSLCRPVPLCVEIGVLPQAPGTKSDAGQRLLVRQRCGADKSCPQRTTCSEKSRCITRAQAERANLLTVAAPSASAASGGTPAAGGAGAPKKACGCDLPGRSTGDFGGAGLALLGVAVIASRRRARQPADRR
jgi:hypothetical protein